MAPNSEGGGRPLGSFERALALTAEKACMNVVAVLRFGGATAPDRLERALDLLESRYPLLAARLVESRGGPAFQHGPEGTRLPLRRLVRAGGRHWRGLVEEELVRGFDAAAGPLMRCTQLVPADEDDGSEILLTFHHAAVDATCCREILRDLLSLSGEPVEPAPDPRRRHRLPAPYRGLAGRWRLAGFLARQLSAEAAYRWRTRGTRPAVSDAPAACRILTLELGEETTRALAGSGRRRRVTLNDTLQAALLLAVARHRRPDSQGPLRTMIFPDLRPYLQPPVPAGVLGSYSTSLRLTVRVAGDSDVWELAGRIHRQVEHAFKSGGKYLAYLASPFLMRAAFQLRTARMATAALSYTGVTRLEPGPGWPRLEGLHAFTSNFPLGPEYTAQVRWYRSRLWWDVVYLDSDMDSGQAGALAEDIRDLLEGAARDEGARR